MDDEKGTSLGPPHAAVLHAWRLPQLLGKLRSWIPAAAAIAHFGCGASAGKSYGDFNSPFASFYFGAFGNNYIDHLSIDRYREFYSFPGVGIDAIGGRSFGKLLGEYNLPPKRFRELGTTWLYVNWARFTLFSSDLVTNFSSDPEPR